jgi:hypothetical protein
MTSILKSTNFLDSSLALDSDIYFKLGGILLNKNFNATFSEKIKFIDDKKGNFLSKSNFNSSFFETKESNENFSKIKTKMTQMCDLFESVNNERVLLRKIFVELINKKFWQISIDKKNEDFFVNKIQGINLEVLKKKIDRLNQIIEEKDKKISKNAKLIIKLKKENESIEQELLKSKEDIKNMMLNKKKCFLEVNDKVSNNNKSQMNNSLSINDSINLTASNNFLNKKQSTKRIVRKQSKLNENNFSQSHRSIHNKDVNIDLDLNNIQDLYNTKKDLKKINKNSLHF